MTKKEFAEIIYAGLKDYYENGSESFDDVTSFFLDEENMWKIYDVVAGREPLEDQYEK